MKTKDTSTKSDKIEEEEMEDLEFFVKKKKAQTKVLKKLFTKLKTNENHKK